MSDLSKIEWTDATWNPVRGCVKVSPGCAHCYAETFAERWRGVHGHAYEQGFDLRLAPEKLKEPLTWKRPRRVFVNSMSDLFQDGVPDDFIAEVFAVMALTPWLTYQVLTKRADRMQAWVTNPTSVAAGVADIVRAWPDSAIPTMNEAAEFNHLCDRPGFVEPWPLPNVWLGVSIENQHFADERIPLLLQTPAAVRFISAEPLLGEIDLNCIQWRRDDGSDYFDALVSKRNPFDDVGLNGAALDWVIVGGESGPGARAMSLEWARALVQQCHDAGVSCFVKQLGAKPFEPYSDGVPFVELHLKSKKGGDPAEWPAELRVREFPASPERGPT